MTRRLAAALVLGCLLVPAAHAATGRVPDDGEWKGVLTPHDLAAFRAGRCP